MSFYKLPKLDELTKRVTELLPPQKSFFESEQRIRDYSKSLFNYKALEVHKERQLPLLSLIHEKVVRLFNSEELRQINLPDQSEGLRAGLVYHQGILNHPVIIGVDIVANFDRCFNREQNGDILTFSTGNIPLNNYFYRRGFELGGIHVNLYPKKDRNKIIYQHPNVEFNIVSDLTRTHRWKFHSKESKEFLQSLEQKIKSIDFSGCRTLGDQITKINFHLWPLMFSQDLRTKVSNWICLEYDDILSDFLVHVVESNPASFIYKLLFNKEYNSKTLEFFEGRTNAWDSKRGFGTHFFWGLSDGFPVALFLNEDCLQSKDGKISVPWNVSSVSKALRNRQIFPGMFLKYALLVLYAGMKPFAGMASANSIAIMQSDMQEFLAEEFPEEVELIQGLTVNNVTSIPVLLKRSRTGQVENYFAMDIIKDGGLSPDYFSRLEKVPVKYFMAPNLPFMYQYGFNLYGKGNPIEPVLDKDEMESLMKGVIL